MKELPAPHPVWPGRLLDLIRQRDQARDIAVQLEQENAELRRLLTEALL